MSDSSVKAIKWNDSLRIDNGVIDEDHKYLIELCNEFIRMGKEFESPGQAHDLLDKLHEYTSTHFRREEHLQAKVNFPEADTHKIEHRDIERHLSNVKALLRNADPDTLHEISNKTAALLRAWLTSHILKHDTRMRYYIDEIQDASHDIASLGDVELI